MKKFITTLAMVSVAAGASAQSMQDLSVSSTFAFESEYVFRGAELGDKSIQPGVEFGLPVMDGDLYAGVWASQALEGGTEEYDVYVGWSTALTDMFSIDAGVTFYMYPETGNTVDDTKELYVGVSADVMFSPAVYAYYDLDLEQFVVELSAGYDFDLEEQFGLTATTLALGGYIGMVDSGDLNGGQAATEVENGYSYGGATADVIYAFSDNVEFAAGVRYAANNDDATGPIGSLGSEENFWYGVSVSLSY